MPAHPARTELEARVARLEAELSASKSHIETLTKQRDEVVAERDQLRASHERLRFELELLKRRIFVAKAERVDTAQLELEFADKLRQLDALAGTLNESETDKEQDKGTESQDETTERKKRTSKGRRNLRDLPIEEERIDAPDPLYEDLVAQGKAKRIGVEETVKLGWKRGGFRRVVYARVKYQLIDQDGETSIDTAEMPRETFPRSLAAPSLLAHIIMEKYGKGMPLYRIEDGFSRDGVPIDRGTMCRWLEDAGGTAGATVIAAARKEMLATAFCIATDATGVAVQPSPSDDRKRQACRRGHYFVQIADRDHIFFEYTPKETSDAVRAMFRGYEGYIQADAKSVYDVLYREPDKPPEDDETENRVCKEVGCWVHLRRRFWEAALAKYDVGREGLARLGRIFELEASFRRKPPAEILRLRRQHLRPHVDAFFAWTESQFETVKAERGLVRAAFGYAVRQQGALLRVFEDGRLVLDNNRSENQLRKIAVGRHAWLFAGSDDHATSAGHLFSLIASARLHRLDPEAYLRDLFRVLAYWPKDRYLELAPKYWGATRARLGAKELADEMGKVTVPDAQAIAGDGELRGVG
jgi:transposase